MKGIAKPKEYDVKSNIPLFILSLGAVFAGFLFKGLFIGHGDNLFWAESIKFLEPLSTKHPPLWFLLLTPCLVLLSIPIAITYLSKTKNYLIKYCYLEKKVLVNLL